MTQPNESDAQWAAAWGSPPRNGGGQLEPESDHDRRPGRRRPPIDRWIIGLVIVAAIGLVVYATVPLGITPGRASVTPEVTGDPTVNASVPSSDPATPTPSSTIASPTEPPPPPTTPPPAPRTTTRPPTTRPPVRTSAAPPPFSPIAVEAEAPGNLLLGTAAAVACGPCPGGYRVGYIAGAGTVTVRTSLPVSGTRTLTITYESDGARMLKISANGVLIDTRMLTGPGWETPLTFQLTKALPAGALSLTFYNDEGPAPDIDKVVIR